MNIVGNGVDIIQNSRIEKSIRNDKFVKRIFTKSEIKNSIKYKNKASYFAKRFAAKEAFVKSIGTGFRKNINFIDISVEKNRMGKPMIKLNNKIINFLKKKYKIKKFEVFLSLADEKKYSIAYVIVNKVKS